MYLLPPEYLNRKEQDKFRLKWYNVVTLNWKGRCIMKKILSLVLAFCLACLSVSALAEIPESVEDLPATSMDVELEDFFGVWQTKYAVYDDEMASLEDAAAIFGSLPVISIDEEKVTVALGEEEESHEYVYDEEYCGISVTDPETEDIGLYIELTETGELKALFIEAMLELYMAPVEESAET